MILIILGCDGFSHDDVKFEDMISYQKMQSKFVSFLIIPDISAKFVPSRYNSYIFGFYSSVCYTFLAIQIANLNLNSH